MVNENKEEIVKNLRTATICLAAMSAIQVIYYICTLFDIINLNIDKVQNMGIYSAGCLGLSGYFWRQIVQLKK